MINDRIYVCEECNRIFTEQERVKDCEYKKWGHPCKAHPRSAKDDRCEAYLEAFIPDRDNRITIPKVR